MYFFVFAVMGFTAFYATYKFSSRGNVGEISSFLAGIAGMVIYVINPLNVYYMVHIFLLLGYALLPLLFYFGYNIFARIEEHSSRELFLNAIPVGVILTFMSGDPRWVVFGFLVLLCTMILSIVYHRSSLKLKSKRALMFFISLGLFYILFNSFWLVPTLNMLFTEASPLVDRSTTVQLYYFLNEYSNILNVFRLQADGWQPTRALFALKGIWNNLWVLSGILVPLIAFTSIVFRQKDRVVHLLSLLCVLSVLLASAPMSPISAFKSFYQWVVFQAPFGVLWRTAYKWALLLPLTYSILTGFTFQEIYKRIPKLEKLGRRKILSIGILALLLFPTFVSAWPLLTGDRNGTMVPKALSENYRDAYGIITNSSRENMLIIWPQIPSWRAPVPVIPLDSKYMKYLEDVIEENRTNKIGKLLSPLGVKFIFYDESCTGGDEAFLNNLLSTDLTVESQADNLTLLRGVNKVDKLFIPTQNVISVGGFSTLSTLSSIDYDPKSFFFLYPEQKLGKNEFFSYYANPIIISRSENLSQDLMFSFTMEKKWNIIAPMLFSNEQNPSRMWSVEPPYAPGGYWELREINNWDFDYGKGLVFTWSERRLKDEFVPKQKDLLVNFQFEGQNRWLPSNKKYSVDFDSDAFSGETCLKVTTNGTREETITWSWVEGEEIPVDPNRYYYIITHIKHKNAFASHIVLAGYTSEKNEWRQIAQLPAGQTGTSNWKEFHHRNFKMPSDITKIKIILNAGWVQDPSKGNATTWFDDIKIFDLERYTEKNVLTMPLKTDHDGNYILLIRFFQNNGGGSIGVQIDDKLNSTINTKKQVNHFVWEKIGELNLKKGTHKLTLTNNGGFNVVNLFVLIPLEEYKKAEAETLEFLKNEKIVYALEAESDFCYLDAQVSKRYGSEANNGEVLILEDDAKIWAPIKVIESGNYSIALRVASGQNYRNLKINIGNKSYLLPTTEEFGLNWLYINNLFLKKGNYNLTITPTFSKNIEVYKEMREPEIDSVVLYASRGNETLEDIFTPKEIPAEVISYQKIDPTKYIVEVNATHPFMLSFAEAYDPLWIAHVNGERIESIPLYSVINGFWINQTGELEVTIEYEPQKWFYHGSIISITTFLACLACLTYNWTKNKAIWKRIKTILKYHRAP